MKPNPCVVCYLPKSDFGCTVPFHQNLTSFNTHYPLLTYSADPTLPATVRLKATPDFLKDAKYPNNMPNPWALNNMVFWTGVALALQAGYTHMLYLEVDCRMRGDGWDKIVFDEFFAAGEGKLVGGSALMYSPCNRDLKFALRWRDFMARYAAHQFPIPSYGGGGSAEKFEQIVMVNGALGVYDLAWLKECGPQDGRTADFCASTTAWDYLLGRLLVKQYGEEAFNYLVHFDTVYSGYGDVMFDEAGRIKLLTDGNVVGIHQVKSNWTLVGGVAETGRPSGMQSAIISAMSTQGADNTDAGSTPVSPTTFETPDGGNHPQDSHLPRASSGLDEQANEAPTAKVDAAPAESGASSSVVKPKVSIFICTHAKDIEYLNYCLMSIRKFATGFHSVVVVFPRQDINLFAKAVREADTFFKFIPFDQAAAPLGHLHHNYVKCTAYEYDLDADYFLFIDSDCLFIEPVTPADYFTGDKPVLLIEAYHRLIARNDMARVWQEPSEKALGFKCPYETMRRHPAVHGAAFLMDLRRYIEAIHKMPMFDYVMAQKSTFPCGFAEFDTMGAYALNMWDELYHFIDVGEYPGSRPPDKLLQFWSHGPIDRPQDIWHNGNLIKGVIPIEEIKDILEL